MMSQRRKEKSLNTRARYLKDSTKAMPLILDELTATTGSNRE